MRSIWVDSKTQYEKEGVHKGVDWLVPIFTFQREREKNKQTGYVHNKDDNRSFQMSTQENGL